MTDNDPAAAAAAANAAADRHAAAARHQADILVTRAQTLTRNGVDLRNPERLRDFMTDQVFDAITGATLPGCGCAGAVGPAALALIAELSRRQAEANR